MSRSREAILALDLGSTNPKVALFGSRLERLEVAVRPVAHEYGADGRVELPVEPFLSSVNDAIRSCLSAVPGVSLRAITLTSQAQTFTLGDAAGQALMPFVSWQDNRGVAACDALAREPTLGGFGRHSGFAGLLPALQIAQLRRLRDEQPERLRAARHILSLPTFLVRAWIGRAVMDSNLAAMSGLYSLELEDWWPVALEADGVNRAQLPDLVPVGGLAGETIEAAATFGIPPGVPVFLAGNDQTAGAYGAGVHREGGLLVTLGTAQVAYAVTPRLMPPSAGLIRGPFPGGLAYRMAADSSGGNLINWGQTVLAGAGNDSAFFELAAAAPSGCRGLTFSADVTAAAGGWQGIGLHHRPEDFARSILEELCRRMEGMIQQLGVELPADGRPVLIAGGGGASAVWRQLLSERLDCPVYRVDGDPLLGAAALVSEAL